MGTVRAFLAAWTKRLTESGIDSPQLSAELLLAAALDIERQELLKQRILHPEQPLAGAAETKAQSLLLRRLAGEPAAYILGRKEFYGRDFLVTPATLIPRPETELLIEEALRYASGYSGARCLQFADLGTGSGCIAVTFALEYPNSTGVAVDISREALAVARRNAHLHAASNLNFVQGDFTLPIFHDGAFDLIISNPPYISDDEYAALSPEVRDYEPKSALVPGPQGLEHAMALAEKAAKALRSGGLLLMEIGWQQAEAVRRIFTEQQGLWRDTTILLDLSNKYRVLYSLRA